jgi:hypothetical protein
MSVDALEAFAGQVAATWRQRAIPDAAIVQQRLRDAISELRVALRCSGSPEDSRERLILSRADVLAEPHPRGRRTFLYCSLELLDRAGILDILGCEFVGDEVAA